MSSATPKNGTQKGILKSDKAERPGANVPKTGFAQKSPLSEAAVKQLQSTLTRVIRNSEGKATQGNASAGYTLTPSGMATAAENGRLAAAGHNLEMLKRAKDNTSCTAYSAKRGVSALQACFQEEKAKDEEKAKARKGSTQRR